MAMLYAFDVECHVLLLFELKTSIVDSMFILHIVLLRFYFLSAFGQPRLLFRIVLGMIWVKSFHSNFTFLIQLTFLT